VLGAAWVADGGLRAATGGANGFGAGLGMTGWLHGLGELSIGSGSSRFSMSSCGSGGAAGGADFTGAGGSARTTAR
jgi:hypothetical protein